MTMLESSSPTIQNPEDQLGCDEAQLAAVSFLGYVAVKYFGARRGLLLAAAAGGLASSTAVTIANARHAARGEGETRLLAAGVAVAAGSCSCAWRRS